MRLSKTLPVLILLSGCAGFLSGPTDADLQAARRRVDEAKLRLAPAQKTHAPNLDLLRAEFQLASEEWETSRAAAVKEQVAAGAGYVEVGSHLFAPLGAAFPGLGAAIALIGASAGALKKVLAPKPKEVAP